MYIYEHKNWPIFDFDQQQIAHLLQRLHFKQGRLLGGMEAVGFSLQQETFLAAVTADIVKSSEIEGEFLDNAYVRSSIARHLHIEIDTFTAQSRHVEGIVEMSLDALQHYDQPLSRERLWHWHELLFPEGRSGFAKITTGAWRNGPVKVISGHRNKEKIHFEAPPAHRVDDEMARFLAWFNGDFASDPLVKSAIAHFWFVTIHPFDDGNGRLARVLADVLLARADHSTKRFYSMSSEILVQRKEYYAILEKTQKATLEITPWIEWFLQCLEKGVERSQNILSRVLYKAKYWDTLKEITLNSRQRQIINRLIDGFEGNLTSTKWAKITHCSQDTAYRDIMDLIDKGIIAKNAAGGRNTHYSLVQLTVMLEGLTNYPHHL